MCLNNYGYAQSNCTYTFVVPMFSAVSMCLPFMCVIHFVNGAQILDVISVFSSPSLAVISSP